MKATIDVQSRTEGDLIRRGLDDAVLRAMVQIAGALVALTTDQQRRVLAYLSERITDEEAS